MKALSIQPFYATLIAMGYKFIELRTWKTNYRGWFLICSSKAINKMERESFVSGHAIAVANLVDVHPYNQETDQEEAFLGEDETFEGYSWVMDRIIPIKPFPVKGKLGLYEVERDFDSLEPIELDYADDSYLDDLFAWWKDHGFISNTSFLEECKGSEEIV